MTGSRALIFLAVFIIILLAAACQEEKYTEKGIPEVEITGVIVIEGGGALFEGKILSTGSEAVIEHGFLWDTDENPTMGKSEIAAMGPGAGKGEYSFRAMADIKNDIVYYSRAFMKTESLVVYSNVISFVGGGSLRPELVSIVPEEAVCGDTVTITGNYFSCTLNNNKIYFDKVQAKVIYSKSDELLVIVPDAVELPIKVSAIVSGLKSVSELDFTMMQPILSDFTPSSGTFNDVITLSGANFCLDTCYVKVYFNNAQAEILELSRTHYKVKVPPENNVSPAIVQIKYFNYFSYNAQFSLRFPAINDISPVIVKSGNIIHIIGENFNPVPNMNKVSIGGVDAQVISSTATEINVLVPPGLTAGHHMVKISTIQGIDLLWNGSIEVLNPWRKLNDFPGTARSSAAVFSAESNGYMGLGHDDFSALPDFWKYSPDIDIWTRIQDFPITGLDYATGFAIDGLGYVTCGKDGGTWYKALTRYNPGTDSWQTMTQKPGGRFKYESPGIRYKWQGLCPRSRGDV